MKKRLLASLRTLMAAFLMLFATNFLPVTAAFADTTPAPGQSDTFPSYICHASGVSGNYEKVPASSAGDAEGHYGADHQWGRDIIPPFVYNETSYSQNWDAAGQAIWNNGCKAPTPVTPHEVTFTDLTCNEDSVASYTITATTGVKYMVSINGAAAVEKAAGTYNVTAGDTVEVTAVATSSAFTVGSPASWSHEFKAAEGCEVTPTPVTPHEVTFTDLTCNEDSVASYTITATTGVKYMVSINGAAAVEKAAGTYNVTAGDTVEVTAVATSSAFTVGSPASWSHEFKAPTCNTESVTLCHATGSAQNPYKKITVDAAGAYNGHYGSSHQDGRDIIPPFYYNGQQYQQNWTAAGQQLFENGCKVLTAPSVIVTSTTCSDEDGSTGNVSVKVTSNASGKRTYKVTVGTTTKTTDKLTLGESQTLTFSNMAAGTYTVSVIGHPKKFLQFSGSVTVEACEVPPVDVCKNIEGNQSQVPEGMSRDDEGNCLPEGQGGGGETDVCKNLEGNQSSLPSGYKVDENGNCVIAGTGSETPGTPTTPSTTVTPGRGGEVLGAVTTVPAVATTTPQLANTGDRIWTNIVVGLGVMTLAVATVFASRKQTNS